MLQVLKELFESLVAPAGSQSPQARERTLQLAINANTAARKSQCHLLLEPSELRQYSRAAG